MQTAELDATCPPSTQNTPLSSAAADAQALRELARRIRADDPGTEESLKASARWCAAVWPEGRPRQPGSIPGRCGLYAPVAAPRDPKAPGQQHPELAACSSASRDRAAIVGHFVEVDALDRPTTAQAALEALAAPIERLADLVEAGLPMPTAIVASGYPIEVGPGEVCELGRGPQFYWRLERPHGGTPAEAEATWARRQRTLVAALGGDPSGCTNIAKLGRVGGVIISGASKDGRPVPGPTPVRAQLALHVGAPVAYEALAAWIAAQPEAPEAEAPAPKAKKGRPRKTSPVADPRPDRGLEHRDLGPEATFMVDTSETSAPQLEPVDRAGLASAIARSRDGRAQLLCPTLHDGLGDDRPGAHAALVRRDRGPLRVYVHCGRCRVTWWPGETPEDVGRALSGNPFMPLSRASHNARDPSLARTRIASPGEGQKSETLAGRLAALGNRVEATEVGPEGADGLGARMAVWLGLEDARATAPQHCGEATGLPAGLGPPGGGIVVDARLMGAGKTQALSELVRLTRAADPKAVVLSVSPLIAQVEGLARRFDLPGYRDLRGAYAESASTTFDSLARFTGDRIDLLILDEVEAGLRRLSGWGSVHGAASKDRETLAVTWPALARAITTAKSVVLADALMQPETVAEVGALRHAAKAPTRTVVIESPADVPGLLAVRWWPTEAAFGVEVIESARRGQNWAIACTGKTRVRTLVRQLQEALPELEASDFLTIDAEEGGEYRAFDLDRIIEARRPRFLIYSPAITASVSLQTLHFHRRALLDAYAGVAADDVAQMLGRVRRTHPDGATFADVFVGAAPDDEPPPPLTDATEIFAHATANRKPRDAADAAMLRLAARDEARRRAELANRAGAVKAAFVRARFAIGEVKAASAAEARKAKAKAAEAQAQAQAEALADPEGASDERSFSAAKKAAGIAYREERRAVVKAALRARVPMPEIDRANRAKGNAQPSEYSAADAHAARLAEVYGNPIVDGPLVDAALDFDGFAEVANTDAHARTQPGAGAVIVRRFAVLRAGPEVCAQADAQANAGAVTERRRQRQPSRADEGRRTHAEGRTVTAARERTADLSRGLWAILGWFGIATMEDLFEEARIETSGEVHATSMRDLKAGELKKWRRRKKDMRQRDLPEELAAKPLSPKALDLATRWAQHCIDTGTTPAEAPDPELREGADEAEAAAHAELVALLADPRRGLDLRRALVSTRTTRVLVHVGDRAHDATEALRKVSGETNSPRKYAGETVGMTLADPGLGPERLLAQVTERLGRCAVLPNGRPARGPMAWALVRKLSERQHARILAAAQGRALPPEVPSASRAAPYWLAATTAVARRIEGVGLRITYGAKSHGPTTPAHVRARKLHKLGLRRAMVAKNPEDPTKGRRLSNATGWARRRAPGAPLQKAAPPANPEGPIVVSPQAQALLDGLARERFGRRVA